MKKLKLIPIFFISIIIVSCNSGKQIFNSEEIKKGQSLYFYNIPENDINYCTDKFKKQYEYFYIDDFATLKKIKKTWKVKDVDTTVLKSFYILNLVGADSIIWGGLLDCNSEVIMIDNNTYKFDIGLLEKYSGQFKNLNIQIVTANSFQSARKFLEKLEENKMLSAITKKNFNRENFYKYNGEMTFSLLYSDNKYVYQIRKKIENDFNNIPNTTVINIELIQNKEYEIKIYCKKDISIDVSKTYKLKKQYTTTTKIEFYIFGEEKEKLENIILKNNLNGKITIKKIKPPSCK
jgi:hypothetical protein